MNLGFPEMLFLGLLALLLFGPRRLPEIGRQIGKALGEFKRASSDFQTQLEDEVRQLEVQEDNQRTIAPPAPEGSVAQTAPSSHASAQEQGANVGQQEQGANVGNQEQGANAGHPASSGGVNGGNGAQGA
ncbi:MAG: twin-arginine translocase TatA/TatE family subunit [Acidobacteriota bacterium]|nr:twin-arginine translocase TatA/TatE family subunit [Acidobacteriota bacterium]